MDNQSIAQMLGNYGEFIGAIAVVVTLLFLAGAGVCRENRGSAGKRQEE